MVRGMCVLGQVTWVTCVYMITFKLIPVTHQLIIYAPPPLYLPTAGEEGVLFYSLMNSGELDLTHTEVPPSQRGRGLGAVLAKVCPKLHAGQFLFAPGLEQG